MATVLSVIERALRQNGDLDMAETAEAHEAQAALEVLQDLYFDAIDQGADLTDVQIDADYTAGENERIFNTTGGSLNITLPEEVEDLSVTPDANGDQVRPPHDFTIVSIAGSPRQTYVYDAYLGAWVEIESLTLTSTAPWSTQLGQGLVAMLAVELCPGYRKDPHPVLVERAAATRLRILSRFQSRSLFLSPDRRWDWA